MAVSLRQKWLQKTARYMFPVMMASSFNQAVADDESTVLAMLHTSDNGFAQAKGDFEKRTNLTRALSPLRVSPTDIHYISEAMKLVFDPSDIKPDMKYSVLFEGGGSEQPLRLVSMRLLLNDTDYVDVVRRGEGKFFDASEGAYSTERYVAYKEFSIGSSLYQDAVDAGVPVHHIHEAIRLLSWEVDFQRDIHPDNTLKLYYSVEVLGDKPLSDRGDILYFDLQYGVNSEKNIAAYRYEYDDGEVAYYRENGESIQNAVLKTPVDGARISSGYDLNRLHPVYNVEQKHRAVDFAASVGTPIQAAGDGLVIDMGFNAACGKRVVIVHSSKIQYEESDGRILEFPSWTTEYCHLSKRARDLEVGERVSQGEVIGYVGTTGTATGPHLHLVVRKPTGTDKTITSADWEKQYPGYHPIDWQRVTGDVVSMVRLENREEFGVFVADVDRQMGVVSQSDETLLAYTDVQMKEVYEPKQTMSYMHDDSCNYSPVERVPFYEVEERFKFPTLASCSFNSTLTP